jgi:D-serine deaminase-like pyridoxal phosphate-dependent protein
MREWMVTPSVVVDETRLQRNVQRMQQLANDHHVQLRPHVKTHKTVEITAMQLQAGACGITVAKPSEAHKFLHSGLKSLKSILVAYPVVQTAKIGKLLVAAQQFGMEVRMTIDSAAGIDAVEKAANSCDYQVKVLIHIDVGYHRVGLEEGDPKILEFTKRIEKSPNLEFTGLLSHAGMLHGSL